MLLLGWLSVSSALPCRSRSHALRDTDDSFVPLAVIRHAHGVRGEVKIASLTETPVDFLSYALRDDAGRAYVLTRTGTQPGLFICRIEGVGDRNAAEALKGRQLGVSRSLLPAIDVSATYVHDLVGLRVIDSAGSSLGAVRDVVDYGAGDIVVIACEDGKELMLPYASQYFPADAVDGTLLCDVPDMVSGEAS